MMWRRKLLGLDSSAEADMEGTRVGRMAILSAGPERLAARRGVARERPLAFRPAQQRLFTSGPPSEGQRRPPAAALWRQARRERCPPKGETMKKTLIAAFAATAALFAAGAAQAGSNVYWSIGISAPPVGTVIS